MLETGQSRKAAAIITTDCVRFFFEVGIMFEYMNVALMEANKAFRRNEVPIGAVIVFNNKIIAKAFNNRNRKIDVTNHAEIIAIRKAARKLGDWRLSECDLYVTLEPCDMCKEVIRESRLKNVYYLIKKNENKKGFYKTNFINTNTDNYDFIKDKYLLQLSTFFKDKCNR